MFQNHENDSGASCNRGGKTETPSNHMMKKKTMLFLYFLLVLGIVFCGNAFADEDPIVAAIEISPNVLAEPGPVNVKITVSNAGETDLKDPVYLYTPQGKAVSDFGTDGSIMLKVGESKTWNGTYNVNTHTLEDGKIVYYVKYTLYDSNGQPRDEKQPLTATISKGSASEGLTVDRVITPTVAKEGQEIIIKYSITNNGDSSLYNVSIQENKSVDKEKQTISELKPGKTAEATYKIVMGKKKITSSATITYATTEKGKAKTYKVEEQVIPLGEPGLEVSLESSAKGVVANGAVTLKLTLKNTGTVGYSDIRVSDPTLGEVFSGVELAAGKTITLEKEITVPETMEFQFTVNGVDETGSELSVATNAVPITAISENDVLKLDVSVSSDRSEVFQNPGQVRFTIEIHNPSNVAAKNLVLSHGNVTITNISELKPGETTVIHRDIAVSNSGRFRFSVAAVDPLENHLTFNGNDIQIVISAPTAAPATPTPIPDPTAVPTVPVFTVPSVDHPSIAPAAKAIHSVMKPIMIIFGSLCLASAVILIAAKVKREINKKVSSNAVDSLETSEHRVYTQQAQNNEDNADFVFPEEENETNEPQSVMMDEDTASEEPRVKYAQKAVFIQEENEDDTSNVLETISSKSLDGLKANYDFDIDTFFKPKEEIHSDAHMDLHKQEEQNMQENENPNPAPKKRRGNEQRNV